MSTVQNRPTILIAEDDDQLRTLYKDWLQDTYEIKTANDGLSALQALDNTIDILLLDRRMPNLTGDEVLTEIENRTLSCRVAMVTAVEPSTDIVEMQFDDYLVKPVSETELTETIEHLLRRDTYDNAMQEYFSLVSKRAVLETELTTTELEENPEYNQLVDRIAELKAETELIRDDISDDKFEHVFRDLADQD